MTDTKEQADLWESALTAAETDGLCALTLGQFVRVAEAALYVETKRLLGGAPLTQTTLGALSPSSPMQAAVWYWVAQLTAELSRLQYWTATNDYATGLQVWQIFRSYTLGPVSVMGVYNAMQAIMFLSEITTTQEAPETD